MPDNSNAGIRFVLQTGAKKEDDETTRKAIRRHVMLGKNRGRTPQPRQPSMQGAAVFRADDWAKEQPGRPSQPQPMLQQRRPAITARIGTDLSFLDFADTVEPPLMNDTLLFCSATNENMFVLAPCISFEAPDTMATCISRLACDALYVNVMVFGTQAYLDQTFRQTAPDLRGSCIKHYGRALGILRERIAEAERRRVAISDITLTSVIILGMHALATGQYESARNHVIGLGRMMGLRDRGFHSFSDNKTRSVVDLLRCDISISLATGEAPILFPSPSCKRAFCFPNLPPLETSSPTQLSIAESSDLLEVWDVLAHFCGVINRAAVDQTKLPEQMLVATMASVMYRLLATSPSRDSTDEATRLAMLSFCASTFLYWGQMRMPFEWLQSETKQSLNRIMGASENAMDCRMTLWMVMMYNIAFPASTAKEGGEMRTWIAEMTAQCKVTGWGDVRKSMKDCLWIDIVYDEPARELIEAALALDHV